MTMTRRSFLKGMLGAAGAIVAGPAICKAENLMKIFVPPEPKILLGRGMTQPIMTVDEAAFSPIRGLAADYDGDTLSLYLTERSTQAILSMKHFEGSRSECDNMLKKLNDERDKRIETARIQFPQLRNITIPRDKDLLVMRNPVINRKSFFTLK